ncbi:MAG: signal peptidase II, partial [Myxococcales bacterium]
MNYLRSYLFLFGLAGASTAADLASKQWAVNRLSAPGSPGIVRVVDHFNLVLAHNKGGAGSFLSTTPDAFRMPFFLGVSSLAIVAMVVFYRRVLPGQWALRWGLPLMLGGALGNLVDRVRYGHVIDFLQVYARIGGQTRYWPTFNVADIAISVGVGLLGIDLIQQMRTSLRA